MGISVDTCPTFEACSTFNLCIEDRYNVACALLQPQVERNKDGSEKLPPQHDAEVEQRISGMIGLGNEGFGKEVVRERENQRLMQGSDGTKRGIKID